MASRGLLIPPSYVPYIFSTAAAISVVPIVAGAYGVLDPRAGIRLLNFRLPRGGGASAAAEGEAVAEWRRLSHGLLRMYAIRQVSLGLTTLALWWTGSVRAAGWTSVAGGLVALTDAVVAREVAGEHVAGHWVGFGLSLVFSGTFLGVL